MEDRPLKAEPGVRATSVTNNDRRTVCEVSGWAYYAGQCAARHVCLEKPGHEPPHRCQCGFTFEEEKPE